MKVQRRRAPNENGEVIEKVGNKWKVKFTSGRKTKEEVLAPQSLKLLDAGNNNTAFKWTVVDDVKKDRIPEYKHLGVVDFDFSSFAADVPNEYTYCELFKKLWPGDIDGQRLQANDFIADFNN